MTAPVFSMIVKISGCIVDARQAAVAHGVKILSYVDWNLRQSELLRRLVTRVSADDYVIAIDHDRLSETEFLDRMDNRFDGPIVDSRIVFIRLDPVKRPHFDKHLQKPFLNEE